jgi:hypothetical protein
VTTLFDTNNYNSIITRIQRLKPDTQAKWGKMNVSQMMAHCSAALDAATGRMEGSKTFMGKYLGPLFKKQFYGPKPYGKGVPTDKKFIITDQRDFFKEKQRLLDGITDFYNRKETGDLVLIHPFFGKLTAEQYSAGMYKHLDHHLSQFGV